MSMLLGSFSQLLSKKRNAQLGNYETENDIIIMLANFSMLDILYYILQCQKVCGEGYYIPYVL